MRLLFNATNLRSEGGVVLMRHLLEGFLEASESLCIILYLNPELMGRLSQLVQEHPRIELVSFRPRGSFGRFFWEQVTLPGIIRKEKIGILFSFGNTGPVFPGCQQVLYLQQSIPFTSYTPRHHRLKWWSFKKLYGLLIGLAQLGSSRIIVPTGWLKSPMRKSILGLKPESAYRVTLPGLPEMPALPEGVLMAAHEIELLEKLETWRAAGTKILLYPCYLAPYKNIPWLLEALSRLKDRENLPDYRLVLTFDKDSREYFPCRDEVFQALETSGYDHIILAGSLSRYAMTEVYRRTDILLFPSLVETLGLPLLEAMAHGIPVVATQSENTRARVAAFSREICENGALYASPESAEAFSAQVESLLRNDEEAFLLGQTGLQKSRMLSWKAHVLAILDGLL